jgi:hypothetical protein
LLLFFVPGLLFGEEEEGDCSDDGSCVAGDCENGWGMYIYPDGSQYAGQYKDGLPHGQGELIYMDGSRYAGKWKDGFPDANGPDGQGTNEGTRINPGDK